LKALFSGLKGWTRTAPQSAVKWFERMKFVHDHSGWTFRDYDEADAADILLDHDYHAMMEGLLKK
jgi:hypothetical protein